MARATTTRTGGKTSGAVRTAPRAPEMSAEDAQRIGRQIAGTAPERDGRERPLAAGKYFARRPFGYNGQQFDREQVLQLVGLVNDAKLVDLKYLAPLPTNATLYECPKCPGKFLSMSARNTHVDKRHAPQRPKAVMDARFRGESEQEYEARERAFLAQVQSEEDATLEREERVLNQVAPLDLTMTTASRMG